MLQELSDSNACLRMWVQISVTLMRMCDVTRIYVVTRMFFLVGICDFTRMDIVIRMYKLINMCDECEHSSHTVKKYCYYIWD